MSGELGTQLEEAAPVDARVAVLQSPAEGLEAEQARDAAFADIVDEYAGMLHGIAINMVGLDRAEDVVQDAFLNAFLAMDRFDPKGQNGLKNWLASIARNRALNVLRSDRNSRVMQMDEEAFGEGTLPTAIASRPSLDGDPVERQEFKESVAALDALCDSHHDVLVLRWAGYSPEEISERLGLSDVSTKSRLNRARRRAGELIEESGALPAAEVEPDHEPAVV